MKSSIQNKQIFNDYAIYIISVILSFISTFLGFLNLFVKFNSNSNIFVGLILMSFLLLISSRLKYEYFSKNKNNFSLKLFYYICCLTLIILSLFIIQNLNFS